MDKYFLDTMDGKENGLYLVQLPTGTGKSYSVKEAFREYASDAGNTRRIIYLTSLNKNIAEKEFQGAFGGKRSYKKNVLYIRANLDEVLDKLPGMEVPAKYRSVQYDTLMKAIRTYKGLQGKKGIPAAYLHEVEDDLRKAESDFRRELVRSLNAEFAGKPGKEKKKDLKKRKLDAIRTRKDLRWIGELYPAVFTDDYRIILMSVSKFMLKNSTLVEPSYAFLDREELIRNSVIFIDEFDATKETILSGLVDNALAYSAEYLQLFLQVQRGISKESMEKMSSLMRKACEEAGEKEYERLTAKADTILQEHQAELSFKLHESCVSKSGNFLFKDGAYQSLSGSGKSYIRAEANHAENRIDVFLESREEYYRNMEKFQKKREAYEKQKERDDSKKPMLINVYGMLRDIDLFLEMFRVFLAKWAENYMELVNGARGQSDIMMTMENARNSIFEKLNVSQAGRELITGHVPAKRMDYNNMKEEIPDTSFYNRGFQLFDLADDDSHNETTYLNLYKLSDTPEKVLAYLAQNASVLGISATAELPSVIGNYDLDYMRDVLGPKYHVTPAALTDKYRKMLEKKWKAYEEGKLMVSAEVVPSGLPENDDDMRLDERTLLRLRSIFSNESCAKQAARVILDTVDKSKKEEKDLVYPVARYCNIAYAMRWFTASASKSMVHLEMTYPGDNKWEMDKKALEELLGIAISDCGAGENSCSLFVLHDDYENSKEMLLKRLSAGEKLYIMSSYKTIGAGQNLQHAVLSKEGLIDIFPEGQGKDKRNEMTDFDTLYLGNVTHSTVNLNSSGPFTEKDVLTKFVQLEELAEHGEMSRASINAVFRKTLRRYSEGRNGKDRSGVFAHDDTYKTESVRLLANRTVIQAVGRMERAHLKSRTIHIFIDGKLSETLVPSELEKHIMSPELKAVRKALGEGKSADLQRLQEIIINKAENLSFKAQQIIRTKLSQGWDEESMHFWIVLRDLVMRLPTASEEDWKSSAIIRNLYITAGEERSSYQYIQLSDYSTIAVNFFRALADFRRDHADLLERGGFLMTMSEAEARLNTVLKYPGMREYFEKEGFATSFKKNLYLMSAVIYNNIYKGALGEYCGRYILEKELGLELKPITDPSKFEFFDFELSPDVYVDFKNWKFSYQVERKQVYEQIERKLDEIGGKKVYIINLVGDSDAEPVQTVSGRIVEIRGLMDADGNAMKKAMEFLAKEAVL